MWTIQGSRPDTETRRWVSRVTWTSEEASSKVLEVLGIQYPE